MGLPRHLGLALVLALPACAGTSTGGADSLPPKPAPRLEVPAATSREPMTEEEIQAAVVKATADPASGSPKTAAEPEDRIEPGDPLGYIAGVPLMPEDLILEWHQNAPREVWYAIEKLVAARLAFSEAQRLGMRLEPESVRKRVEEEQAELEARVDSLGVGLSVEDYVRSELGIRPEQYFDRIRSATIRQMLAERAVRAWTLENDTVAVRLIVLPTEEQMTEVQEALAGGADFAELAREHSVDDSARLGGYVPYVIRQEHAPMARLAFATSVGKIAGPLPTGDHHFLIRVESKRAPVEGPWEVIEGAVEASLAENPLTDAEWILWKLAMEKRYPIELSRLQKLLDSPR